MLMNELGSKSPLPSNDFMYHSKERNHSEFGVNKGLEWYDYDARNYNATLARWNQIDPLADKFKNWSPYNSFINNPLRNIDPDGRAPEDIIIRGANNSSLTVKTDLIDVEFDVNDYFDIDFKGDIELSGSEIVHLALDLVGIGDASGFTDALNADLYLKEGDYKNAAISAAGVLLVGDILKTSRILKGIQSLASTIRVSRLNSIAKSKNLSFLSRDKIFLFDSELQSMIDMGLDLRGINMVTKTAVVDVTYLSHFSRKAMNQQLDLLKSLGATNVTIHTGFIKSAHSIGLRLLTRQSYLGFNIHKTDKVMEFILTKEL